VPAHGYAEAAARKEPAMAMRAVVLNVFTGLDGLEPAQLPDPVARDDAALE